ncbi:hypothetical protein ACFWXA_29635 [Streptomyces atroolivaceus]|uniref:hypothetical protein n=1 Tax=Streptomyces atroolivaceus TaxID=66869 RepID=UPI0036615FD4
MDAISVLMDTIRSQFGDRFESVPAFNDSFRAGDAYPDTDPRPGSRPRPRPRPITALRTTHDPAAKAQRLKAAEELASARAAAAWSALDSQ